MSYEGDKERLVRELADAQKQIRSEFGMIGKPKAKSSVGEQKAESSEENKTSKA
jgi:hypothetical protein